MFKVGDKVRVLRSGSHRDNIGKTGLVFKLSEGLDDVPFVAIAPDVGHFKDCDGNDAKAGGGMFFRNKDVELINE